MFASISGLRINFTKTKMVWIGSKKFSKDVFHHSRWKLTWNNTTFDLLGIKFSVNLQEMPELNYKSKFLEIEQTIKQWKSRKLTPIGRIVVIKTLIVPKMNHLILTLPNPDHELIQKLDKALFNYLWGSDIHKIKKNTIIQDYNQGGLKMIDYKEFMLALKSTWIRRLLHSSPKWIHILEAEMNTSVSNLWSRGTEYTLKICKLIHNCFWKEVLLSWTKITDCQITIKELIPFEHIWYNPRIKINKASVFLKQYFNNGMICIIDLFDLNGNFITYETIINSKVKTNYVEYVGLRNAIFEYIGTCNMTQVKQKIQPYIPMPLKVFYKSKKGCKDMYNLLTREKKKQVTSVKKLERERI